MWSPEELVQVLLDFSNGAFQRDVERQTHIHASFPHALPLEYRERCWPWSEVQAVLFCREVISMMLRVWSRKTIRAWMLWETEWEC